MWSGFDQNVSTILESTMQGNIERKIKIFTNMVFNIGNVRFGKSRNEHKE